MTQATQDRTPSTAPAYSQRPAGGLTTSICGSSIWTNSRSTARKSFPSALEKAPGTFSHTQYRGRTAIPVRPRSLSAFLISFTIRICSMKRPERSPESPALAPATLRSWHGLPPQIMSTGGSSAPFSFVMSPTWSMLGKRAFVTAMGKGSISLAHTGSMPAWVAASGKPPIPSKRLPMVIVFTWSPPARRFGWC